MDDIERLKKLGTTDGFVDIWRDEIKNHDTYNDAFESVNQEYEDAFGRPKYSCYQSFSVCLKRKSNK